MKLLVLTSEPISAQQLRYALPDDVDPGDAEIMIVAPAPQENPIKFWFSDADDAITKAEEVRRATIEQLGDAGVAASGDTGESDPVRAIEEALQTFAADRIVLSTHPGSRQSYREDIDIAALRERFGLPVDQATVSTSSA